ncbi:unnamed protein product, partial [Prorocentrum cordatum]
EGAARPAARDPVVIQLELLIGEAAQGRLHVLLQAGLDGDIEKRLAACLAPSGAAVEALAAGAACAFAGHGPLPRHAPRARAEPEPAAAEPAEPAEPGAAEPAASEEAAAGAAGAEAPVEPVEAQDDPCEHCTTGLLSAPRQGPGLLLTLGPQAHLDDSHQVWGDVNGQPHRLWPRRSVAQERHARIPGLAREGSVGLWTLARVAMAGDPHG